MGSDNSVWRLARCSRLPPHPLAHADPGACLRARDRNGACAGQTTGLLHLNKGKAGALSGYDPVAYFTVGKPTKGAGSISASYEGATWYFASEANRATFQAGPAQYAPQYGGYCAWAVSQGYNASADPEAWKIVDGKLYVNYSQSVAANWAKDIPTNISKANANWPKVLEK